ncbi:MAG: phosphoribosylglycinamide formyltransferase [Candidatus Humimicrobiaceae bacterium]
MGRLKRIATFASGYGSNLQAIIDYFKNSNNVEIGLVFSNNQGAYALKRAENSKIKKFVLDYHKFDSREEYDREIAKILITERIDLIVLAGYMLLLSDWFVDKFKNKILNIHPSLLPSFKGTNGIKDAFDYGVKITGVTVHFVDKKLDHGPIILQKEVNILSQDSLETLEEKIHKVEHELYPLAIQYYCEGKLKIKGRKVIIT